MFVGREMVFIELLTLFIGALSYLICAPVLWVFAIPNAEISNGDWIQVCATVGSVSLAYFVARQQISLTKHQIEESKKQIERERDLRTIATCRKFMNIVQSAIGRKIYHGMKPVNWFSSEADKRRYWEENCIKVYFDCEKSISALSDLLELYDALPSRVQNFIRNLERMPLSVFKEAPEEGQLSIAMGTLSDLVQAIDAAEDGELTIYYKEYEPDED